MTILAFVVFTFVIGGFVKGVSGIGLPTVCVGLLGLIMAPAEAAALMLIPGFITNIWQFLATPGRKEAMRRHWPFLVAVCLVTAPSVYLLRDIPRAQATFALGIVIAIYGGLGLFKIRFRLPRRHEAWLGPVAGGVTGVIAGATGSFVVPNVPYLQALDMERDDLVQAIGLTLTALMLMFGIGMAIAGRFHVAAATNSALCCVPAFLGMAAGQRLRGRITPHTFDKVFFAGMVMLGLGLLAEAT